MRGEIVRLTRYVEKGAPGEILQSAVLIAGGGMEGDRHAGEDGRRLSLLAVEDRQWIDAQTEPGLCFRRYKENILFKGIPSTALVPGVRPRIGEAALEIAAQGKRCFEECPLFCRGEPCVLAGRNLFAKVIKGGIIRIGDSISI